LDFPPISTLPRKLCPQCLKVWFRIGIQVVEESDTLRVCTPRCARRARVVLEGGDLERMQREDFIAELAAETNFTQPNMSVSQKGSRAPKKN